VVAVTSHRTVFHLTTDPLWRAARAEGSYRAPTFEQEGFIHCSNADQVERVARERFADVAGVVLLEIDVAALGSASPLVDETGDPGSDELFPHVYGPIPVAAVVSVEPYDPRSAGALGRVVAGAVTLYVGDLDASIAWYRDLLGLEPVEVSADEFPYARFKFGQTTVVLEPAHAATDPHDSDRTGAAAVNLVVERDPAAIRTDLVDRGAVCTPLKRSPGFVTFLVRDPDGHRIYVTKPTT
jgi:uncharacterized protein (DUF952 family)/catechol 2,3-dioxygenase-like lactoylglutathione lyase family enzyme